MAELTAEERALIHNLAAKVDRNSSDIQKIWKLHQHNHDIIGRQGAEIRHLLRIAKILTSDKQSVFKWAMGVIAAFVIAGSSAALLVSHGVHI